MFTDADARRCYELKMTREGRLSAEDQAANKLKFAEFMSNPEKLKAAGERMDRWFAKVDTDGTGILQWEAYRTAAHGVHDEALAEDGFIAADLVEEEIKELFELHSRASGNEAGVTLAGAKEAGRRAGEIMKAEYINKQ